MLKENFLSFNYSKGEVMMDFLILMMTMHALGT